MFVTADELSEDLRAALIDCGGSGDSQWAVDIVRREFTVTGDPESCAAFLRGYGAWDSVELSDHDRNLDRLVWLAGCALREDGEFYFDRS